MTAEIIRGYMETVCFEMATHVSLTATTPILNQSNERNATIHDGRGRLAALSVGIPQFMLSATLPIRFALDFFGQDGLHDGDVLVANDPYHGGGHLPDYNVFAPVVHGGEVVLIASIQCHHADTGGGMPGGYNVEAMDIWAEGVRLPAVKVVDRGEERRDVVYFLQTNSRTPTFLGDLRAQMGAARYGARRLKELCARHGNEAVKNAVQHSIDTTRRRVRAEVSKWPDGVYEADAWVDHDPKGNTDIRVHCKVTVKREKLTIDFTGSDERQLASNSTFGNTRGYVVAQIGSMMDPTIPKNEGFFDEIELVVPKGCCLNPHDNRPVAAGTHHPGVEVGEAIALALSKVMPERCCPQVYKMGMSTILMGTHPRTRQFFVDHGVDTIAANCGAIRGQDGWGSMNVSFGNLIRSTAEIQESIYPHRQMARDYVTDSGGPGEFRGGCGVRYRKAVTAPCQVFTFMVGMKYPVPGIAGGRPGAPNHLVVRMGRGRDQVVPDTARYVAHQPGEFFEYTYAGGGGWGDPLDRDPERVLEDVLDEYVSIESARLDYGVALGGTLEGLDLRIDREETDRLRAEMRKARGGPAVDDPYGLLSRRAG